MWTTGFQAFEETYGRVATMLPSLITAPLFWQRSIEFGAISKMFTAFRSVKETLLFAANNYDKLASISARIERIEALQRFPELWTARRRPRLGFSGPRGEALLVLEHVRVAVPSKRIGTSRWLGEVGGLSVAVMPAGSLLIRGESGVGKSSLLRAIAGLWTEGSGHIFRCPTVMFLPQTSYLPAGERAAFTSLREQLLYPDSHASDAELSAALEAVDLGQLVGCLSDETDWSTALSGGEKQRLVLGRLLVQLQNVKAPLVLLDEATSACSEALEARLYAVLAQRVAASGGALVSVGHRSSLKQHHAQELLLLEPAGEL